MKDTHELWCKTIKELEDAIDKKDKLIAEKEKEISILTLKNKSSLANNLCPDHRDKQGGKSCLACIIEGKDKVIAQLKKELENEKHQNPTKRKGYHDVSL